MPDPAHTLAWQAQRIEALEAEVAWLREKLADASPSRTALIAEALGVTRQRAGVLRVLEAGRTVTIAQLVEAMDTASDNPPRALHVCMSHLRKAFRQLGVGEPFENHQGLGYRLTPYARRALAQALDGAPDEPKQEMSR
jgi:hypothetical protein